MMFEKARKIIKGTITLVSMSNITVSREDTTEEGIACEWRTLPKEEREQAIAELDEAEKKYNDLENTYIVETQLSAELASRNSREIADLKAENERLKQAIKNTLEENGHLADGDVCALYELKQALKGGEW
jgi:hypothetical protein